jgi:DNA-binding MarR family transcriptional regulator
MEETQTDHPPARAVELGDLARNIPFLTRVLRAFVRTENASFYRDLELEPGGIAILNLIGINPGMSQNDLADAVVIKKSAVTKLVKQLEARGFLERRRSSSDRRFNALTLTAAGEEKCRAVLVRMNEQQRGLLAPFSPDEQEQLFALLNRLLTHLAGRNAAVRGRETETPDA